MTKGGGVNNAYSKTPELDQLVEDAREGNDSAFEKLWRHFQPKMLRYLSMFTRDAEDICSEVWIRIAGAIKGFDGDSSAFQGWVFTIARNAATDHARKQKRMGHSVELKDDDWIKRDSPMVEVTDLLKTLPKDQAEIIMLRIVVGLNFEQVAEITGKSASNVRVLSHRGLARLSEELTKSGYKRGGAE